MKKTALITGASSGIGLELARIFAEKGNNLILVARRKDKLEALKKELETEYKIHVMLAIADLTIKEAPVQIKEALDKKSIKINTLVNNAGFGDFGLFKDADLKKQDDMIELNINALTKMTRLFINEIIESKGEIMNVASVAAFQPGPYMSVYYATKAYVLSFTEALAEELKGTGVKVSALCPGPTKTGFAEVAEVSHPKMFSGNIPTAREAAEYGYKALKKGKVVAIHGLKYQALTKITRILPRKAVTKMVRKISESR